MLKKLWGRVLYGIAKGLDVILGGLIRGLLVLVQWVDGVREIVAPIFTCLVLLIFFNPMGLLFLNSPVVWLILLIMIFPLLGKRFASFLEYGQYILCEYLYDRAAAYQSGQSASKGFSEYGQRYRRAQQRKAEEARRARQRQQEEEWQRLFEEWFRQANTGGYYRTYYDQQGPGVGGQDPYRQNPATQFIKQYEDSCATLRIPTDTNAYEVKLAYRKLAKQYHPDLNREAGAKEKFQAINAAYEFLSEENIRRYKELKRK